ncbi:MAG: TetR/AcrR family transcriptional regulator [Pseudomonadota bacterium]
MDPEDRRPARGRPRTLDRDHVLRIAVESYWADGPTGVSINEICRRAGVSKPGVYREFGGEDGLKMAALEAYQATVLAPLGEILAADLPFDEALKAITDFAILDHKAHGLPDGCLQVAMCRRRDELGRRARASAENFREKTLAGLRHWIDKAKSNGQFPDEVPTHTAALYVEAQISTAMELQKQGVAQQELERVFKLSMTVFS